MGGGRFDHRPKGGGLGGALIDWTDRQHQLAEEARSGKLADVNIVLEKHGAEAVVPCIAALLAVASSVFRRLLFDEDRPQSIRLQDDSPTAFRELQQYAYGLDVNINANNAFEVLLIATKYQVGELGTYCLERVREMARAEKEAEALLQSVSLLTRRAREDLNSLLDVDGIASVCHQTLREGKPVPPVPLGKPAPLGKREPYELSSRISTQRSSVATSTARSFVSGSISEASTNGTSNSGTGSTASSCRPAQVPPLRIRGTTADPTMKDSDKKPDTKVPLKIAEKIATHTTKPESALPASKQELMTKQKERSNSASPQRREMSKHASPLPLKTTWYAVAPSPSKAGPARSSVSPTREKASPSPQRRVDSAGPKPGAAGSPPRGGDRSAAAFLHKGVRPGSPRAEPVSRGAASSPQR